MSEEKQVADVLVATAKSFAKVRDSRIEALLKATTKPIEKDESQTHLSLIHI